MSVNDILNEREKTHGDFDRVSETWVQLMNIVDDNIASDNCSHIAAIYMILLKLARIACGNPNHADHWDDIAGYAMLGKGEKKESLVQQMKANHPEYFDGHIEERENKDCCNCTTPECFCEEPKEPSVTLREWINKHGSDAVQKEIKRINEEIEKQEDELCDYDPSNCETCEFHMTPWSNATWKLHKPSPVKKERCKACKSKSCCAEECPLNPLSKCAHCGCVFDSCHPKAEEEIICHECLLQHVSLT